MPAVPLLDEEGGVVLGKRLLMEVHRFLILLFNLFI